MGDLIEALTIFLKYKNPYAPTHCEHDEMIVNGIPRSAVSDEDAARLSVLSFEWDEDDEYWRSFRFGSS